MNITYLEGHSSRYLAILNLASSMGDAPADSTGTPCVSAYVEKFEGKDALVVESLAADSKRVLVLNEKEASVIKTSLEYLQSRLKSIGFKVLSSEAALSNARG